MSAREFAAAPDGLAPAVAPRWQPSAAAMATLPILLLLLVFFVWPIAGVVGTSFLADGLSFEHYVKAVSSPVYRQVFANTLMIGALVTFGTILASYPFAYVMATASPRTARILAFVVLLPFWTSALVRTTAWIVLLQRNGILNNLLTSSGLLDEPVAFLYNLSGVLIGMIHVLMPFMVFPLYAAFRAIDGRLVEAAAGLGAGRLAVARRIILPLTAPGVAAGGLIVFMSALGYYITPSLMGGPRQTMIAQMISYHMMEQLDWGMASALSLILLGATLAIFGVFQRFFGFDRLWSGETGAGIGLGSVDPGGPVVRWTAGAMAAAGAAFLMAPILIVFPMSISSSPFVRFPPTAWTLRWYENLAATPKWATALGSSVRVAVVAIVLSLILGSMAAIGVSRLRHRGKAMIEALILAPMIVPPIILAIALYYLYAPLGVLGSPESLALGHALLAVPFVFITVRAALRGFDRNLELAALGLGAGWMTMFRRVMLPAIWPGVVAGAVFAFITSFDDVVLALFLTDVRSRTLPRVIYEGVKHDIDPTIVAVAALLVLTSLCALVASLTIRTRR